MKTRHQIESLLSELLRIRRETASWTIFSVEMSPGKHGGYDVIIQANDERAWWRFNLPAAPGDSDADISAAFDAALLAWFADGPVTTPPSN